MTNRLDLREMITGVPDRDFWICRLSYIDSSFLTKEWQASSSFILYLRRGRLEGTLNGNPYFIAAPAIVILRRNDRLMLSHVCPTLQSDLIIMSEKMADNLQQQLRAHTQHLPHILSPVVTIPQQYISECDNLMEWLEGHLAEVNTATYAPAAMFKLLQFYFSTAYKFYIPEATTPDENIGAEISRRFIRLANRHHVERRFLDFYADQLGISTKHLSRTVKRYTGIPAVEWIDIFIVIDAKILLSTTTLSIREIADRLNFSSQSFFGKYFKKYTGISPKDYRRAVAP